MKSLKKGGGCKTITGLYKGVFKDRVERKAFIFDPDENLSAQGGSLSIKMRDLSLISKRI